MTGPMPLAGWEAPICKCGHPSTRHPEATQGRCVVEGCGCTGFRGRDEEIERLHGQLDLIEEHEKRAATDDGRWTNVNPDDFNNPHGDYPF